MTDEEFAEAYAEKNYGTHPKMADLIACSKLAVLAGIEYAKKQFAEEPCTSCCITDSLEQSLDDCNDQIINLEHENNRLNQINNKLNNAIEFCNGGKNKLFKIKIKPEPFSKIPEFKTEGAVCADCYAYTEGEKITIYSGTRQLISLGFSLELPENIEAVIRPRSGNSKKGIDVAIGTIDTDYRGIVMANVINNLGTDFVINHNDRICQIAFREVPKIIFDEVTELSESTRGENGFGSTGI